MNIKNSVLFYFLSFATIYSSFLHSEPCTIGTQSILYGGLNIGINQTSQNITTDTFSTFVINPNPNPIIDLLSNRDQLSARKNIPTARAFFGFSQQLNNTNLGFGPEIFVSISSTKKPITFNAGPVIHTSNLFFINLLTCSELQRNRTEAGIDFVPRLKLLENAFVLGRIGLAYNRIKMTTKVIFNYNDPGNQPTTSLLTINQQRNRVNLRLGLGFEQLFFHNLAFNINYIYTDYGRIKYNGAAPTVINSVVSGTTNTVQNGLVNQSDFKLRSQAILIGLTYFFPI